MGTNEDVQAERDTSGEGEIKDLGEGGGMNWRGARADGKDQVEPCGLASERRRPTFLDRGILCLGQCWTPSRCLEIHIKV